MEVSEAILALVLDVVPQPVWVVDVDDNIFFANPAAVSVLGYDDFDELRGKPSHDTVHKRPDRSPYPREECRILLPMRTGEIMHGADEWFARRDGSMFPISWWCAPISLPSGPGAVL